METTIEFGGFTATVKQIGHFNESYEGDAYNSLYEVKFSSDAEEMLKKIEDWKRDFISRYFPSVSCQHSYDCCAHYYPNSGEVIKVDTNYCYLLISQRWQQNI